MKVRGSQTPTFIGESLDALKIQTHPFFGIATAKFIDIIVVCSILKMMMQSCFEEHQTAIKSLDPSEENAMS
jgi:hypothetical protein